MLRLAARKFLEGCRLYGPYSLTVKGPLLDDGWFRSFEEQRPVDRDGHPVPFITYPAIEFLTRRIRSEMTVFEYGCGASTLWWSQRVRQVEAAEHQREWYERIAAQAPANVRIHYAPLRAQGELERGAVDQERGAADKERGAADKEDYARLARESGRAFSIVVIDGRVRVRCARHAVEALAPDGVIVWDNSDRAYYEPGFRFLEERGFRRLEFVGVAPGVNEKSETSVFYRPGNCLGI